MSWTIASREIGTQIITTHPFGLLTSTTPFTIHLPPHLESFSNGRPYLRGVETKLQHITQGNWHEHAPIAALIGPDSAIHRVPELIQRTPKEFPRWAPQEGGAIQQRDVGVPRNRIEKGVVECGVGQVLRANPVRVVASGDGQRLRVASETQDFVFDVGYFYGRLVCLASHLQRWVAAAGRPGLAPEGKPDVGDCSASEVIAAGTVRIAKGRR